MNNQDKKSHRPEKTSKQKMREAIFCVIIIVAVLIYYYVTKR